MNTGAVLIATFTRLHVRLLPIPEIVACHPSTPPDTLPLCLRE